MAPRWRSRLVTLSCRTELAIAGETLEQSPPYLELSLWELTAAERTARCPDASESGQGTGELPDIDPSAAPGTSAEGGPDPFTIREAGGRVIVNYELAMLEVVDTLWPRAEDVIASIDWSAE